MIFNLDDCSGYINEVKDAANRVIDNKWFILGEEGRKFEREFADYVGAPFCVGVGNGTDAIRIALLSLGVGPGDEVISPAFNVAYTALAVQAVGAKNVFADVDPETMLMDFNAVENVMTKKTRVILPVHLFGQMSDVKELTPTDCLIVEDAAQAHGASFNTYVPGTYSDAVAYSFYPTKNLGAWGEAGGITTRLPIVEKRARLLRDGGRTDRYIHELAGINSCMDELQAAVLRVKLKYLNRSNEIRRELAKRYKEELTGIGDIRFQVITPGALPVYHLFVIRTELRDHLFDYLREVGIPTHIHYPVILPHQPFALTERQGHWPHSEKAAREVLSLPMHPNLTRKEQDLVIQTIKKFFN